MYAELAFFDDPLNLSQADHTAIVLLSGAASNKPEVVHGEYNGVEDRPVTAVEGTIDENIFTSQARGHGVETDLTSICREQLCQPLWRSSSPRESSFWAASEPLAYRTPGALLFAHPSHE